MSLAKHRKTYGVFLAIIIGVIVISFVFTGVSRAPMGGVDTVAMVGKTPVKGREYQMAIEQTMQFANTYFGGKLRPEDLEQLKRRALDRLIQSKLMLNVADRMDLTVSSEEISKTIKTLPYFQTKQGFNLDLYKQALAYQGMTPAQFEESLAQDMKVKELTQVFQNYSVSKTYGEEIKKFQEQKLSVSAVRFSKKPLEKMIVVSDADVQSFLKEQINVAKVKSLFESRKSMFDRPEEVKARHILIKAEKAGDENAAREQALKIREGLTTQNFAAKANQLTQDPSGKGKGGDLGWFSRGRMVPEFEKEAFSAQVGSISAPVKSSFGYHLILVEGKKEAKAANLADYEKSLAKEIIQSQDSQKLEAVAIQVENKLVELLSRGDKKGLEEAKKNYGLMLATDAELNLFDGAAGAVTLDAKTVEQIFNHPNPQAEVFRTRDAATVTLIKVNGAVVAKAAAKKDSKGQDLVNPELAGIQAQNMAFTEKLFQELLKKEQENTKIRMLKQI